MPDENDIVYSQYSFDWPSVAGDILGFFTSGSGPSAESVLALVNGLWLTLAILSFIIAALCFVGYVYAAIRFNQLAELETEQLLEEEKLYQRLYGAAEQPSRFDEIKTHVASDNPNDWKLAIIEADIELERMLDAAGYPGTTIGEKLKAANPATFTTLEDAWGAHKVRNRIAHDGSDFVLTKKLAQETILRYQRVFAEFDHR
jgi:hypothetical protein